MSEHDFTVRSYRREYSVNFVEGIEEALTSTLREGDFLVIDANVARLFAAELETSLAAFAYRIVEPSEPAKSYQELEGFIAELLDHGFRKNHRLIAIGGGIVQDITAFTSSILYRGVDWIFLPSNLLSQCDSCIGSKTSINFGALKNQLGGFYPPDRILIANRFLDTVERRELLSGLGEMAHYFLVSGDEDFQWYAENLPRALEDKAALPEMIHRSLAIKKAMIERDEFDEGPRNVFNYGHTFGHALESVTDYSVPHGIAVSYGMDLANAISEELGLAPTALRQEVRSTLGAIWEEAPLPNVNLDQYFSALSHDKKNEGNRFCPILTRGYGKMFKADLSLNDKLKTQITDWFENKLYLEAI